MEPARPTPDLRTAQDLASRGNVIPIVAEVPADLQTPVAAFLRIAGEEPRAFLLESVEGGESMARYSFLGTAPTRLVRARRGEIEEEDLTTGARRRRTGDPREVLRDWIRDLRPVAIPELPRFTGGAVGYLAYDAVRSWERVPDTGRDPLGLPDLEFALYDTVLAFDHLRHRIVIIANLFAEGGDLEGKHRRACDRLRRLAERLAAPLPPVRPRPAAPVQPVSNLGPQRFAERVARAQRYIRAGDVFQVVLSQRFQAEFRGDPFSAYRALRRINPSPYMFFLRLGEAALAGASPEMLVRVEGERVETRPIAGTRPRGRDRSADLQLEAELRADPKECAEHVMLVDLGRNDLGRVCRPGTVCVEDYMSVERYSHVMHLVTSLRGRLRSDRDALDALAACFPAGTVTGAPKVRAMEIIDELEEDRRGPYAGAVGYLDLSGNLDSCITIRTLVLRDGQAYVQAGAGIVADSQADREHGETVSKAGALLAALQGAGEWFP